MGTKPVDEVQPDVAADAAKSGSADGVDPAGDVSQAVGSSIVERRSRRRLWPRLLIGTGIAILIIAGWVAFRAIQAYQHLSAASGLVGQLQNEVEENGISRSAVLVDLTTRMHAEATEARSATDDPLYRAAGIVPWVGTNLDAVRHIAAAVDSLAEPLPDAAVLAGSVDTDGLVHDGGIDIATVRSAIGLLDRIGAATSEADREIAAIDRGGLVGRVATAAQQIDAMLPRLAELSATGSRIGGLALPMLGADAPRTYLVVFQNLAEPRATGGIFGSYAALHVDGGRISLSGQGSASRDIGEFDRPQGGLDSETNDLYSPLIATYPMNVNFTPDFPSAAERFVAMYIARTGERVDGVIAIDPVVIATLLQGRDSIAMPDGTELKAGNISRFLLSEVYTKFPTGEDAQARDAYLAAATSTMFDAVISGGGDLAGTLKNLRSMIDQRRVLIWSADPAEQSELGASPVGGRLGSDDPTTPTIGVFANDGSGSKLGYYLDGDVALDPAECRNGEQRALRLTSTFRDSSPESGLPPYVLGGAPDGSDAYDLQLNVLVVAPTGGTIGSVRVDGRKVPVLRGTDHGRAVSMVTISLTPGSSSTVTATVLSPAIDSGQRATPRLLTTPGARAWKQSTEPYVGCLR